MITEVQQNHNITYRVSDYGRIGVDGEPKELQIDRSSGVTKYEVPKVLYGNIEK